MQGSFRKLLESQHSKMHVIVSFLAILELMKMGEIVIEQKELFDDIMVSIRTENGLGENYAGKEE